ncbi:hypothetical protein RUM43_014866 [Polyplax serrata]|uniref:Adenylate kinase isoenzyme 5 n=1 Tax=Polyplax serrata TaxID=468196 RepID=A0AAN8NII5_POLSC
MGICLDTDQQNGSQVFDEDSGRSVWAETRGKMDYNFSSTPPEGRLPMQNGGYVKFEVPKVPVIFVLGGPGSGKVTHGDNLMHEKRGITHINMTDLLQQYAIGNEMKDFGQLSSKTVTEVLMLEMKMAPAAKTYLVSGYPRSMRDVVEYAEKIQMVNGVILVAWQQKVLERQIDYGAKIGHVVLGLAKMELNNFYKNVMPVADYFDERGMLIVINGERNPAEVYKDFRSAVLRILGSAEQVAEESPPAVEEESEIDQSDGVTREAPVYRPPDKSYPPVIWVLGGPGSNKASLCQKVVRQAPGWTHFSVGRLLRAASDTNDPKANDSFLVRQAISAGEMVPQAYVLQLVETEMITNKGAQGILMDGFPRDMAQVHEFESKFQQQPNAILLDCSKLQLGRGRIDDSVAAFRKRLELFRELSLPMLKILDNENRLTIVDGDTDTMAVQEEFSKVVLTHTEHLKKMGGMIVPDSQQNMVLDGGHYETQIHDLEDPIPAAQPVLHNRLRPVMNGAPAAKLMSNGIVPQTIQNGLIGGVQHLKTLPKTRPSRDTIRVMYADVENYQ